MRISDWSSDVCSSDLLQVVGAGLAQLRAGVAVREATQVALMLLELDLRGARLAVHGGVEHLLPLGEQGLGIVAACRRLRSRARGLALGDQVVRSEEHTSELQSLMRISYAVFCLKKKKYTRHNNRRIIRAKK